METTKSKIIFDKLDKKCIQSLPLMIDVISSTFNKIKSIYDPFYEELTVILKTELKHKSNWHLFPRQRGMVFYPFTYDEITNTTKISTLKNYFGLWGELFIYSGRRSWSLRKASFCIELVVVYSIEDDIKVPYSYFQIYNQDVKKFGPLSTKNFYSKLCKSLPKNIKGEFTHPSFSPNDESIWIYDQSFNTEHILLTYNAFRDKILKPFILNLK